MEENENNFLNSYFREQKMIIVTLPTDSIIKQ